MNLVQISKCLLWLFMLCEAVSGLYEWGGTTCSSLEAKSSPMRGTGCVGPGSIPHNSPACEKCVFDYQCESGWCVPEWKKCYKSGTSCYTKPTAGCRNCPSSESADLSQCECKDSNFPNNWVQCTNGSQWKDQYDLSPGHYYQRKTNYDGSLLEDDEFAIYSQCYHNKFRQDAAKLNPLRWNSGLASFAHEWTQYLKDSKGCSMKHSGRERSNIGGFGYNGENLYWYSTSGDISQNDLPEYGRSAAAGWYSEMKYYQYAGPDASFDKCGFRNNDKGGAQIGHLTQLLWDATTDIGCDYAVCNGGWTSIVVSCVYGPGGNFLGQAAFNTSTYCALNEYPENQERYGGLPACVSGLSCAPKKDGRCRSKNGGTCKFPFTDNKYGTIGSCQDAVYYFGYAKCVLEETPSNYGECQYDTSDPDCEWVVF
ncbi:uncharacterized protein LOC142349298 isoform X2 [Convolutriloba macropyga]|uniref:uncharacterized protein LOC142349298 isoform X2 n=1 Tax=Convolutriloba macropyga TaxID=536237 RepID=UPI003F528711